MRIRTIDRRWGWMALLLAAVAVWTSCQASPPNVLILGDMEKPTGTAVIGASPNYQRGDTITLAGAGNEVVAFQVMIQADHPAEGFDVRVGDLTGPSRLAADPNIQLFLEHYATADDASYSWGPRGGAGALPWRGQAWPDALIPLRDPNDPAHPPVCVPFSCGLKGRTNQGVWVDVLIPKGTAAGVYRGKLEVLQKGTPLKTFTIELTVYPFTLSDETHTDTWGELYRENGVMFDSRVKFKQAPDRDWPIYRRYLQMAHAHRFLATERQGEGPQPRMANGLPASRPADRWDGGWDLYTPYVASILDGSLFTPAQGYAGPCAGAPPSIFPAPFVEAFAGGALAKHLSEHGGRLDPAFLATTEQNAQNFADEIRHRGWEKVRWFAYIFDEVDGGKDTGETHSGGGASIEAIHDALRRTQEAIDRGTDEHPRIDLVWTSHANPARWAGTKADLSPFIRWWIPNGDALDPKFFGPLASRPDQRVWFYHSGQPAVGNHTINQLGIDLRLWGLLCRRYHVHGSFWWSMMNFSGRWDDPAFNPYDHPVYKEKETRWGNGVLFYPGWRLIQIGARRNIVGPIPSMRMKALRRGLQDFEYCWLADRAGKSAEVDQLLKALIPAALGEAPDRAVPGQWSQNPEDYDRLRARLAELIGRQP